MRWNSWPGFSRTGGSIPGRPSIGGELLKRFPNEDVNRRKSWQQRLDQIVGNWGRFEPAQTQPAGKGASLEYRFRNGKQVEFTAHEIKVEKLLDDVKTFLKSNPQQIDWQKINIGNIGYRLVQEKQKQYIGRQVAQWQMPLTPRENHFDKRVTVATPLTAPGAYLVTAKMADGNTSLIVVWIDDTAIVKKMLSGKSYYFVADAVTGKPMAKANVEFFGWRQLYHAQPPRYEIITKQFAESTDADGQVMPDPQQQSQDFQWLVIAADRRRPVRVSRLLGRVVRQLVRRRVQRHKGLHDHRPARLSARPEGEVQVLDSPRPIRHGRRLAVRQSGVYRRDSQSQGREDRHGEQDDRCLRRHRRRIRHSADATLGVYSLSIPNHGGGSFRVEEYKKPEFEVTVDAPDKPVMLGEKITATIKAKYYFGSPVTEAKVKYKVDAHQLRRAVVSLRALGLALWSGLLVVRLRLRLVSRLADWGCCRPMPFWWPHQQQPPELVADQEVEIGPDGTVKVEIDTAVAKAIHPDQDHSYTITAEVVDASRRTIVGTGTVLVARKPFTVYAWLDRGYYHVGDTIHGHFSARTLDGKPVEGKGEFRLLKISYKDGKPVETPVQTWPLDTNAEGVAEQQMTASQAGNIAFRTK